MANGVITRTWDVMHFAPPLVITKEEVDRMVAAADEALIAAEKEFAGEITD
jgi:adenosylmethionine-8-amino-7-oxononanoate aminotransferase